jgi:hypothetical protein
MIELERQIHDYYDRITIPVTTDEYTRMATGVPVVQRRSRAWVLAAAFVVVLIGVGIMVLMAGESNPSFIDQPETSAPDPTTTPAPAVSTAVATTATSVTSTTTTAEEQGAILATTKAKPLPAQATCPPGSDPDTPGPVDQRRPRNVDGAQAFDRHAGRIIVLANDEQPRPRTWTFDVCRNVWQRMDPPEEPGWEDPVTLVYDADSDRTIAFARNRVWSYDLAADRWTKEGELPSSMSFIAGWGEGDRTAAVYHHPSGLVIVYDRDSVWAYDVETDTWTEVAQTPDPSRPVGLGLPEDVTAVAYDRERNLLLAAVAVPDGFLDDTGLRSEYQYRSWLADAVLEIWAFDPATGVWRLEPSQVPASVLWSRDGWFYGPVSRVVFDEANGVTIFMSVGGWVEAYDGRRNWRASRADGSMGDESDIRCHGVDPVYDPLHGRIVCQVGGGGVSSFATATGEWTWLLKWSDRTS